MVPLQLFLELFSIDYPELQATLAKTFGPKVFQSVWTLELEHHVLLSFFPFMLPAALQVSSLTQVSQLAWALWEGLISFISFFQLVRRAILQGSFLTQVSQLAWALWEGLISFISFFPLVRRAILQESSLRHHLLMQEVWTQSHLLLQTKREMTYQGHLLHLLAMLECRTRHPRKAHLLSSKGSVEQGALLGCLMLVRLWPPQL